MLLVTADEMRELDRRTIEDFGIPGIASGIVLAVIVGMVIIGGIKRIGAVTGRLVPIMVALYLLAAMYVLIVNFAAIPEMFGLIFKGAFSTLDASGAFIGGTMGQKRNLKNPRMMKLKYCDR